MTANVVTITGANMSAGEAVGTYGEVIQANAGTNSSGSAPVLTATSVTIGHTSSANDVTIMASAAATAGQVITFRLPAGWYFKWTGTTTAVGNQVAVGC